MSYPFIIQGNNVVVVIDNKPHTISKTHITYQKVVDAIKTQDWETVKDVIEPKQVVLDFAMGFVKIKGETLYWQGKEMHNAIATRMIEMLKEEFSVQPLVFFMENLMENPSYRSVQELYSFLEKNNLPITPDGHFLAYKKVRRDFRDIHSGTMDNSVGKIVEMERNKVDDNKEQTCSTGLHFCSQEYLPHFGGGDSRVVIVKINPRDVVSIPVDYNNAKGRACRYEVIGELNVAPEDAFTCPVQETAVGSQPVPRQPKSGATPFYKGYSDGYNGTYNDSVYYNHKDLKDYDEGYNKGQDDASFGIERYRYVKPEVTTSSPWPMPAGNR